MPEDTQADAQAKVSEIMHLKGQKCPYCRHKGIDYLGRNVLHGNPSTPASDTEVELLYYCPGCELHWSDFA